MYKFIIVLILLLVPLNAEAGRPIIYDVTIKDGVFTPSQITVPTHQRIKINISNIGISPAEFENLSLIVEKTLGAGVQSAAIIPPLRPGTYKFIDEFHPNMAGFTIISK